MSAAVLRLSCDAADLALALELLAVGAIRVADLAPFAGVRDRLLSLGEVADQLVQIETAGDAVGGGVRLSLRLSEAGLRLSAALRARDVDPAEVEAALGLLDCQRFVARTFTVDLRGVDLQGGKFNAGLRQRFECLAQQPEGLRLNVGEFHAGRPVDPNVDREATVDGVSESHAHDALTGPHGPTVGADVPVQMGVGLVDHPGLSCVSQPGEDAESPGRETDPAATREARP